MQKTGQPTSYKPISYTEYTYPQGGIYETKPYTKNNIIHTGYAGKKTAGRTRRQLEMLFLSQKKALK